MKTDWLKYIQNRDEHLEPSQKPRMKFFSKHHQWPKAANYLCKIAPPQVLDQAPNRPPEWKIVLGNKKQIQQKNIYEKNMKSFSNETLSFSLRKFWYSYILILPKLYELWESCSRNPLETTLQQKSFEHWRTVYL